MHNLLHRRVLSCYRLEEDLPGWVARSPRCPEAILDRLWRDPHKGVRCAVAKHPGTPEAILRALARDSAP